MEGRRRILQKDEMGEIKKGPWKAEEDQVLINHVKKYGPRDWSSIRSKGLLRRTGKSCRLRWVNKLRPDLKTGVKFSTEEERTVIDLQAQFGNKWARIATYLPGRTDNDVKNFWSSRQKRLARMLLTSSSSSSSSTKLHKNTNKPQPITFLDVPSLEAPKFSSSMEEETIPKSQSCSSPHTDNTDTIKMVPFMYPSSLAHETNSFQLHCTPPDEKRVIITEQQQSHISFPLDSEDDIVMRLGDPNFLDEFEKSALGIAQLPMMPSIFEPDRSCQVDGRTGCRDSMDIDSLIYDFPPIDIFDHIPSPSEWS